MAQHDENVEDFDVLVTVLEAVRASIINTVILRAPEIAGRGQVVADILAAVASGVASVEEVHLDGWNCVGLEGAKQLAAALRHDRASSLKILVLWRGGPWGCSGDKHLPRGSGAHRRVLFI